MRRLSATPKRQKKRKQQSKLTTLDQLQRYMEATGISGQAVSDKIGVSSGALYTGMVPQHCPKALSSC